MLSRFSGTSVSVSFEALVPTRSVAIYNVEYKDTNLEENIQSFLTDYPTRVGITTPQAIENAQWEDNPPRLILEFADFRGAYNCIV